MDRILQTTSDGSHTIAIPSMEVTYHSKHGAIQESRHVFIEAGWNYLSPEPGQPVSILEMGFGTGLNALLTLVTAGTEIPTWYESLDAYPIDPATASQLNYCQLLGRQDLQPEFLQMHSCKWDEPTAINSNFTLFKRNLKLEEYQSERKFDLVYFDAFAPNSQPQLWTENIFSRIHGMLHPGAILVTYCSKGDVRRALTAAGFRVEKIAGPPGKREMLRAHY